MVLNKIVLEFQNKLNVAKKYKFLIIMKTINEIFLKLCNIAYKK